MNPPATLFVATSSTNYLLFDNMAILSTCLGLTILASYATASLVHASRSRSVLPDLGLGLLPDSSNFVLKDNIVGREFYTHFAWQTFDDPTHGRVDYVDLPTAQRNNLTSGTTF